MEQPNHTILTAPKEITRERVIAYVLAGSVNLAFVLVLIYGLAVHYIIHQPPELKAAVIPQEKQEPQVALPKPTLIVPKDSIAPPEIQVVQPPQQQTIQTKVAPAAPSAAASPPTRANGITSTHTTPPYPPDAKSAGHQGTVLLHIMISASGDVTSATVSKSSGFPELDQTAVDWVIKHWKYKPATDNGTAVASASDAQVVFDLKKAND